MLFCSVHFCYFFSYCRIRLLVFFRLDSFISVYLDVTITIFVNYAYSLQCNIVVGEHKSIKYVEIGFSVSPETISFSPTFYGFKRNDITRLNVVFLHLANCFIRFFLFSLIFKKLFQLWAFWTFSVVIIICFILIGFLCSLETFFFIFFSLNSLICILWWHLAIVILSIPVPNIFDFCHFFLSLTNENKTKISIIDQLTHYYWHFAVRAQNPLQTIIKWIGNNQ